MREIVSFSKEIEFKTMVHTITGISLEHTLSLTENNMIQGDFIVSGTYKMTGASQIEEKFNYKIPVDIAIDDKYDVKDLTMDIYDFVYEVINEEILKLSIDLSIDNLELKEIENIVEDNDNFSNFDEILDPSLITEELENIFVPVDVIEEEKAMETDFDEVINVISEEERQDVSEKVEDLFKEVEDYKDIKIVDANEDPIVEEEEVLEVKENTSADSIFMAFNGSIETYSTYRIYIVHEGDSVDTILNKYNITREVLEEYNNLSNITKGSKIIIPNINE